MREPLADAADERALEPWLARPGLPPDDRLLILAKTALAPAAWARLGACARIARARGLLRTSLEETLLQGVLYFGFPRAVTAFETLHRHWPSQRAPAKGALPVRAQRAAGRALFDRIYAKNSEPVRTMLRSLHPELHDFVLTAAYGRILTRPGLPSRTRELLATAALATLDQLPQLIAHARGALACGATAEEVEEAIVTGLTPTTAPAAGRHPGAHDLMRRVLRS